MNQVEQDQIKSLIRSIPDFPEAGVVFRDITTALKDAEGLRIIMDDFVERYKDKHIDYVLGADARGFIFGAALAYAIGAGFVPARKPGKLPAETVSVSYDLEYGSNSIEVHKDAFTKGDNVLVIDDLLATGGTVQGAIKMVEELQGEVVGCCFLIELSDLNGRELLEGYNINSLITYE